VQTATTLNPSTHRTAPSCKVKGPTGLSVALFGISLSPTISPILVGVKTRSRSPPNQLIPYPVGGDDVDFCLVPLFCHPALSGLEVARVTRKMRSEVFVKGTERFRLTSSSLLLQ